jgi:oligopeptide transport system substrate-binding protein
MFEPIENASEIMYEGGDPETLGIDAIDDYTLDITTVAPMTFLPKLVSLALFWPLPRWAIEEHEEAWTEAENIVSNGPYILEKWEHDQEVVLVKNPSYSGTPAKIDRVVVQIALGGGLLAYQADEVDLVHVGTADLPVVEADPTLNSEKVKVLYKWLFFVTLDTRHPPFDDVRVRQALYLAIDRETLCNDVLKGTKLPAYTYIPEGTLGHNADARIPGDVSTAQQLLADAGYPDGEGFPKVKLTMSAAEPGDEGYLTIAAFQAMWKQNLGIDIEMDMIDEAAFWDWVWTTEEVEYDMSWSNWAGDFDDPAQWYVVQTGQTYPVTGYSNPEYDNLIIEGSTEADPAKRAELYAQAEEIGVADAAVIPVFYESGIWLVKSRVKGLQFEPLWGVVIWRDADIVE